MKKLLIGLLVLTSFSALACPAVEAIRLEMNKAAKEIVALQETPSLELFYAEAQMEALMVEYEKAVSECAKKVRENKSP